MSGNPSANVDAVSGQGEFHPKKPGSVPDHTGGHAMGTKIGNAALPTFSAETVTAGTAPTSKTYTPNPASSTADGGDGGEQEYSADATTNASETLGGATSKDVHAGLGKPVGPQSSAQLNSSGDNVVPGKKDGQGLVGLDNVTDAKNPNGPKNA